MLATPQSIYVILDTFQDHTAAFTSTPPAKKRVMVSEAAAVSLCSVLAATPPSPEPSSRTLVHVGGLALGVSFLYREASQIANPASLLLLENTLEKACDGTCIHLRLGVRGIQNESQVGNQGPMPRFLL